MKISCSLPVLLALAVGSYSSHPPAAAIGDGLSMVPKDHASASQTHHSSRRLRPKSKKKCSHSAGSKNMKKGTSKSSTSSTDERSKSKGRSRKQNNKCTKKTTIYCDNDRDEISICHHDSDLGTFETMCLPKKEAKRTLKDYPSDDCGPCQVRCATAVKDYEVCDDGNPCALDLEYCSDATDNQWVCEHRVKECSDGLGCDESTGNCVLHDQLIPCVAVIDEDTSMSNQFNEWEDFRTLYPLRPFYLLTPPSSHGVVHVPDNFVAGIGTRTVYVDGVARDYGDRDAADDWYTLCGLDKYGPESVPFVGLFIDNSNSLKENDVAAARDILVEKLNAEDIQVKKVVNTAENWIEPFRTELVPAPGCKVGSVPGKCIKTTDCANEKMSVPNIDGMAHPNCVGLDYTYSCCITPPACTHGFDDVALDGVCMTEKACNDEGGQLHPYDPNDATEPNCSLMPEHVSCCI